MSKVLSSLMVLIIFTLMLWAFTAWSFSANTNKSINQLLTHEMLGDEYAFLNAFDFEVEELSNSILGSTLNVSLIPNGENAFLALFDELDETLSLTVKVVNGPVLFDQSGIQIGRLRLKITADEQVESVLLSKLELNKLPIAHITLGFDKQWSYTLPLDSASFNANLKGRYDFISQKGQGNLFTKNVNYQSKKQTINSQKIELSYSHQKLPNDSSKLIWSSDIFELLYQHEFMDSPIEFVFKANGSASINANTFNTGNTANIGKKINAENIIHFKQNKLTQYPPESGNLRVNVKDLSINSLENVMQGLTSLSNLQEQYQWVLDEQSELPEGQDTLFQIEENISQAHKEMPALTQQLLLNKEGDNAIGFSLNTKYKQQSSRLVGKILPLSESSTVQSELDSTTSVSTLIKAVSNVSLDQALFSYVSKQLPIKKPSFDLIYKKNKLLMQ